MTKSNLPIIDKFFEAYGQRNDIGIRQVLAEFFEKLVG